MPQAIPSDVLKQIFGVESLEQLPDETRRALAKQVTEPLWRQGQIRYLLHATQIKILDALEKSPSRLYYLNCSRRLGKSYAMVAMAIGLALRKPGSRILFLAPTGRDASDISNDLAAQILRDCPDDIAPAFSFQQKEFKFKNGSLIRVRGVNSEHADSLRGGAADLVILDEAGQMDQLRYLVNSVVLPMTLTTGGRIIIPTTPPTTPGHDAALFFNELSDRNATITFTLRDAPRIPHEAKREILMSVGEKEERLDGILDGTLEPETTTAQREFFCRFVTDANRAVVPEYPSCRAAVLVEHPRPPHFDAYTAIDPGSKDNTGILHGYVDFLKNKLVIEDEALLQNPTTTKIAHTIAQAETRLWPHQQVYRRVSDVDLRLIQDLRIEHGLAISPARKDDMLASVHQLRHLITSGRLIINPRCVHLDRQLTNAIWNKRASDMDRAGENSMDGHFDLVAALRYLIRAIDWHHSPYPGNWRDVGHPGGPPAGSWISPKSMRQPSRGLMDRTPTANRIFAAKKKHRSLR